VDDASIKARLAFVQRAEQLKVTLRSAHTTNGRVESVSDHTWRLMLLIVTFADQLPHVDLLRLLKICLLHDLGEAVDGDIPAPHQVGLASKSDKERRDFESLLAGLPESLRAEFLSLWDEHEYIQTEEARYAKAFDKIETLIQHNQGSNPPDFDYRFNFEYGRANTDAVPLAAKIRAMVDVETNRSADAADQSSPE